MNEIIELIGTTLAITLMLSSVLFALMVWLFSDSSKLTAVEKNSWYYWNKEVLIKSASDKQFSLIWILASTQKLSLIGLALFILVALATEYAINT